MFASPQTSPQTPSQISSHVSSLLSKTFALQMIERTQRFLVLFMPAFVGLYLFFSKTLIAGLLVILFYAVLSLIHYGLVARFHEHSDWKGLLPLWFPLILLIFVKEPQLVLPFETFREAFHFSSRTPLEALLGFSYFSFRLVLIAHEIRLRKVAMPRLREYMAYVFFLPIMFVGPISRYSVFKNSIERSDYSLADYSLTSFYHATQRILVGASKFYLFANVLEQITFTRFHLDPISLFCKSELWVATLTYPVWLYCNFSGACDIAIGISGLLGIQVEENFKLPFSARNIKEFWNRWHITLSGFLRELVFTPLSKTLASKMDTQHAVALSSFVVFILIGLWHGSTWGFLLFGLTQAIGIIVNHYYTLSLKSYLGAQRFHRYNQSHAIHLIAQAIHYAYLSFSLIFFANELTRAIQVLKGLL